jgi:ferric iron reductase protein FhuF
VRVAASVDALAVAARLASPVLQGAVREGRVPVVGPDRVWWRWATPGPMRLAWWPHGFEPASVATVQRRLMEALLAPVVDAYAETFRVSRRVLWGNVASALVGAAQQLAAPAADRLVAGLLETDRLRDTALAAPPRFRRASCCLYYRIQPAGRGGGVCGDCVLAR